MTRAEIEALANAVSLPMVMAGASWRTMSPSGLAAHNVKICLRGHPTLPAAIQAMHTALKALREGAEPADLPGLASPELMAQLTRRADYDRWTKTFLEPTDD